MRTQTLVLITLPLPVIGLLMLGGCASRSRPPAAVSPRADQQLLERAAEARSGGRTDEALTLYRQAGQDSVAPEIRRQALLAEGLLHLQPDTPEFDMAAARRALIEAHPLFGAQVPIELTSTLWLSEQVLTLRTQLADGLRAAEGRQVFDRETDARMQATDEEIRNLKRTVRQLRLDLAQKDAALRKAADAVVGRRQPR